MVCMDVGLLSISITRPSPSEMATCKLQDDRKRWLCKFPLWQGYLPHPFPLLEYQMVWREGQIWPRLGGRLYSAASGLFIALVIQIPAVSAMGLVGLGVGLAQLTIPRFGFTYIQEKLYLHILLDPSIKYMYIIAQGTIWDNPEINAKHIFPFVGDHNDLCICGLLIVPRRR